MRLGIELARSVWTPALAGALAEMIARVNLAYLTALDGLPCCPKCAGIRRQENYLVRDVAQLVRAGCGNSLSLAAWQLAEAWKDGATDARIEVLPPEPAAGPGGALNCPPGQIPTWFESPPSSGNMILQCQPAPIKNLSEKNKPQGAPGSGAMNCPPGQIPTTFESPPGSGNMITQCQPPAIKNTQTPNAPQGAGAGINMVCPPGQIPMHFESPPGSGNMIWQCQPAPLTSITPKNKPGMQTDNCPFRYLVHKRGNLIDIAKHYAIQGGCGCG